MALFTSFDKKVFLFAFLFYVGHSGFHILKAFFKGHMKTFADFLRALNPVAQLNVYQDWFIQSYDLSRMGGVIAKNGYFGMFIAGLGILTFFALMAGLLYAPFPDEVVWLVPSVLVAGIVFYFMGGWDFLLHMFENPWSQAVVTNATANLTNLSNSSGVSSMVVKI